MAGGICICEVEEIVPAGEIKPEAVDLPGIFVKWLIKGSNYSRWIDKKVFVEDDGSIHWDIPQEVLEKRLIIAKRAAEEIWDGNYVSLGWGIPSHIIPFLAKKTKATFLSENGVQGLGGPPKKNEIDPDLINTSVETATITPGAAYFKISDSFNIIWGGHVDITFMGGL